MNSVDAFNTLSARAAYNHLLVRVAEMVLLRGCDVRVFHVAGMSNTVADSLSRFRPDIAVTHAPSLVIHAFRPPPRWLGDEWV
jgi:hypothetical protein